MRETEVSSPYRQCNINMNLCLSRGLIHQAGDMNAKHEKNPYQDSESSDPYMKLQAR